MKRTGPRPKPCGTPQVRWNEGELCGGIPTVDVPDKRYEVNHCSETEEMPNQVGVILDGRIRRVIINDDPRSVRYADGVTHSQWVCRTLRSVDR